METLVESPMKVWKEGHEKWDILVVVGLGGTFFYAEPFLKTLGQSVKSVILVDDDALEGHNLERQHAGRLPGGLKADMVAEDWEDLLGPNVHSVPRKVQDWEPSHMKLGSQRVLMVVLVDNDEARKACCEKAEEMVRAGAAYVGVVSAGNEVTFGQAWAGLVISREGMPWWLHDWRASHAEEMNPKEVRTPGCGQEPVSNAMSAACLIASIWSLPRKDVGLLEFLWNHLPGCGIGIATKEVEA